MTDQQDKNWMLEREGSLEETTDLRSSVPGMDGAGVAALVQRLEAAEVGSRELDAQVWCIENGSTFKKMLPVPGFPGRHFSFRTSVGDIGFHGRDQAPVHHYTTSLDAALALAKRVLPGWVWNMGNDLPCWVHLWVDDWDYDGNPINGNAATPALALCAAILKATQSASSSTCGIARLGETQSSNNKGGETNG